MLIFWYSLRDGRMKDGSKRRKWRAQSKLPPCKSSEMSGPRCVNTCGDIPASYVTTPHQRVHAETAQGTCQNYAVLVTSLLIQVPLPAWFITYIFPAQPFPGIFNDEIGNLYINLLLFLYTSTTGKIRSMLINHIICYKHRWNGSNFVMLQKHLEESHFSKWMAMDFVLYSLKLNMSCLECSSFIWRRKFLA